MVEIWAKKPKQHVACSNLIGLRAYFTVSLPRK
jgi:hypothetical protein